MAEIQHNFLVVTVRSDIIARMYALRNRYSLLRLMVLSLLTLGILAPPLPAEGVDPFIRSIQLREGNGSIFLSAELDAQLGEELKEAVRGGVPLTFRFRIRLTREGSILGEKMLRSEELIHTLQYNPVKQFYVFTGEGYGSAFERTTKDEEEAFYWMTNLTDWPLVSLDELKQRIRYRVRVMATLRSVELPSVLGYLFFFTTIFNKETGWKELDFSY